ncbi:MAG: DUF4386 domain-containing protein [Phaeodactylibacter sp.]|nr:DUF4386 domain-containing protein [Phaeodactylibacter sp.]
MKNQRSFALTAGIALILMALTAGFSFGYVQNTLIVPTDALKTLEIVRAQSGLFMAGVGGWVLIFVLDLLVAWALFHYLKSAGQGLAQLMAWTRVIYTLFLGAGILDLFAATRLIGVEGPEAQQVLALIQSFSTDWSRGLIIFGLHLLLLGILLLKSRYAHWFFGALLSVAGVCYMLVHTARWLLPEQYSLINSLEMILSVPMTLGELGFAVWLLVKGGKNGNRK